MALTAASSRFRIRQCCGHDEKANDVRDRISNLSDDILVHVLSSIPTTDAVRTSVLSKRWINVWTFLRVIDIQDRPLRPADLRSRRLLSTQVCFMNFVDRVLLRNPNEVSCFRKLHLSLFNDYDSSRVTDWINVVTRPDHVEEIDLKFLANQHVELPHSIFTSKKLVSLKLTKKVLLNVPSSLVCRLSSLKYLHLVSLTPLDIDSVNNLLAGCPVLEELYITRSSGDKMELKTLYVHSTSLKSLTVNFGGNVYNIQNELRMVIDASNLEHLDLALHVEEQFDVSSLCLSLVRVNLRIDNHYTKLKLKRVHGIVVLELLKKMFNTKHLYISSVAMESLEYVLKHIRLHNLPMFKNMTHLEDASRVQYCHHSNLARLSV